MLILLTTSGVVCADPLPGSQSATSQPSTIPRPAPAATSNLAAALETIDYAGEPARAVGTPNIVQRVERASGDARALSEDVQGPAASVAEWSSKPSNDPGSAILPPASQSVERRSVGGAWKRESAPWYRSGLLSLAAVLVVIAAAAYLIRKLVPSVRMFNGGAIEILGRSHLTPKQSLALVRVGRRVLVIGVSVERLTTLCEIGEAEEVAELLVHSAGRRSGSPRGADAPFDELLGEAAVEFEERPRDLRETVPGRSEPLDRARGKLRGLIGRLKTMQDR
jgi:flagellar biosynthetic protein FliO